MDIQTQVTFVPCAKIKAGNNDRKVFDPATLESLARSIASDGLHQFPVYRYIQGEDMYEIVAGERRTRACRDLLGWTEIPAFVRDLTDQQASAIMLAENTARVNLNPVEEAHAYVERVRMGLSIEDVAKIAGVSVEMVNRRLKLLDLHPQIQDLVAKGQFPLGHAEYMADLDNNREMIAFRVFNQAGDMPFWKFKALVNELRTAQTMESQTSLFDIEQFWVTQVAQDKAVIDKRKAVPVPKRGDLPTPLVERKDTTATAILKYVRNLQKEGLHEEAEIVGSVLDFLVNKNFCKLPE